MALPSVMGHSFSRVPAVNIQRSQFDRSHGLKTTLDAGNLVPVFVDEALPGDTFNLRMTFFGRLATPLQPFMDNLRLDVFYFFVPYRLVWDNWEKFMGAQDNPGDSTDYLIPTVVAPVGGWLEETIYDYMGLPTKVAGIEASALPFRAHNLIHNDWFKDQNLQQDLPVATGDGPDDETAYKVNKRGKRHDYFTSSLPWPQKGQAVELPLGVSAPIEGLATDPGTTWVAGLGGRETDGTTTVNYVGGVYGNTTNALRIEEDPNNPGYPNIRANLLEATAATVNSLRQSVAIQQMYERDARGGTRYTEIIRAHFGVTSPDARLQRPEFLGGGSHTINVNQVEQTSSTDATTPQGNLAAFATTSGQSGFSHSFTEHGVVLGYVCLRADLNYQQGLNRMWSRQTRWDFFWPGLAQLGEQAVLSKEIYADGTASDDDVWGYQERYAEYRYKPSQISGKFRSNATQPLDSWHLAQEFASRPVLNDVFIEENPPVDRVIAVTSESHLILDTYAQFKCARPMPLFGVPGLTRL